MARLRVHRDSSKDAEREHRRRVDGARAAYYQALAHGRDRAEAIAKASRFYRDGQAVKIEATATPVPVEAKPAATTVPGGWENLHWKKRVVIAREIWPERQFVSGADADEAIRRYLEGGR